MTVYINGTTGISGVDGSASTPALQGADTNTGISFGTDTVTINTGGVVRVTTDSSGNVGIGTSSPSTKLHVSGTGSQELRLTANTSGDIRLGFDVSGASYNWIDAYRATGSLAFATGNTERMRIDSSGNLLVGSTVNNPQNAAKLYVSGSFSGGGVAGISVATSSTSNAIQIGFHNPNGAVGTINTSGTSTSYNTSSDYRLKEQVAPMTGALAKNELLNPVTYKWKSDGSDGQGFIAHELQAVFPDAVTGEKDAVDAEGKPVYQGVDTSFLVGHLVACVKELKAELDSVKAELATLKGAA